ncbi:MAG: dienelactone hydrolase family protein [Nevskiaceae bacterium]|nr:MAG: dienelactone hydrolase family protein [Nevskiaceae bacterium]TBR75125.1 MAG: dienelactone hydrolase family protein [Nevskiaceae bacterium]
MTIQTRTVDYDDNGTALQGYIAYDDAKRGRRPTVLIAHQWDGRSTFIEERARELAKGGYVAFALDMYGKGVRGTTTEECTRLMTPLLEDRSKLAHRMNLGLAVAARQPEVTTEEMAAIGYCFGGLCVLDLARSGAQLAGVASFHGLLDPPQPAFKKSIKARILAMSGADDPMVPMEKVAAFREEMNAAGADWQVHVYGGAKHAFAVPGANNPELGIEYNVHAYRRSWQTLHNFLAEVFAVE